MRSIHFILLIGLIALLGCGGAEHSALRESAGSKDKARNAPAAQADGGAGQPDKPAAEAVPRKIIYTASIQLVVETFDDSAEKVVQLVKEYDGAYVANSEVRGAPGARRSGTWTVRVPVAKFDDFLDAVARLGELQQRKLDSDDITDRFHDLKADVQNNQAEEEALRKLLDKSVGKLEDVVTVRRELKDIRGKINQQQGQLQRWEKLSELATATITIQERKDYVSPTAPAFGTSIQRTFQGSSDALVAFGKGLVLLVVAVAPWLPLLAVLLLPLWLRIRRGRRRASAPPPDASAVAPPAP